MRGLFVSLSAVICGGLSAQIVSVPDANANSGRANLVPLGSKGGVLEGATRVPCLISWPAVVRPGSVYEGLVDFSDFLPTFVELAGGDLPANHARP